MLGDCTGAGLSCSLGDVGRTDFGITSEGDGPMLFGGAGCIAFGAT
jgi:hypothetical protein